MTPVDIEEVCKIIGCISSLAGVTDEALGSHDGCYTVAAQQTSVSDLQCIIGISDEKSDEIWTMLEEHGTALSNIAR